MGLQGLDISNWKPDFDPLAVDYARLQQLGVNWFSGDTYERDSGGGA